MDRQQQQQQRSPHPRVTQHYTTFLDPFGLHFFTGSPPVSVEPPQAQVSDFPKDLQERRVCLGVVLACFGHLGRCGGVACCFNMLLPADTIWAGHWRSLIFHPPHASHGDRLSPDQDRATAALSEARGTDSTIPPWGLLACTDVGSEDRYSESRKDLLLRSDSVIRVQDFTEHVVPMKSSTWTCRYTAPSTWTYFIGYTARRHRGSARGTKPSILRPSGSPHVRTTRLGDWREESPVPGAERTEDGHRRYCTFWYCRYGFSPV